MSHTFVRQFINGAATLLTLASLCVGLPAEAGEDLGALVKKTLAAYGGKQALEKAGATRETGRVASAMRGGAEGKVVRTFARPWRLRVEIQYPGEPVEVRVLDGTRGWRRGVAVQGPPLDAMVLQAARLALPLLLAEKEAVLKDLGRVNRDGASLRAIEIPLEGGLVVTAFIDPATGRILHSAGRAPTGAGPIEFGTSYGDFRKVNGVLTAFHEKTVAMGQNTGETTVDKLEHLPSVPKEAFVP